MGAVRMSIPLWSWYVWVGLYSVFFSFLRFFLLLLLLLMMMMMMMMMIFRIPSSNVDKLPLRRGMLPISGARCKLFPCPRQVMGTYGLKVSGVKMTHHSHNH